MNTAQNQTLKRAFLSSEAAAADSSADCGFSMSEKDMPDFEEMTPQTSPFIDRLGRFKRGTYRSMLMQTGLSYERAKGMADNAAEEFKKSKAKSKSLPLAKSEMAEIGASEATIEVTAHQVTFSESQAQPEPFDAYRCLQQLKDQGVDGATAAKIANQAYKHHKEAESFDATGYFQQLLDSGVDTVMAADIANKAAEAKRRDPLERYGIRLKPRRTPDPVHRDSYDVGERENTVWKPVNPNEIGAYLEAVDQYSIKTGNISDRAVRLLKMLFRMVDFKTGRLEPTLDTICEWVGYARATVVRLLKQLQEQGFIRWIRRSIKIKTDGAGPRRKQTSNAYGFLSPKSWPELARKVFERVMRRKNAPVSADLAHAQEADKAETGAMIESQPNDDWVKEIFAQKRAQHPTSDEQKNKKEQADDLAETLASFAKSIERAEQREQEEQAKKAISAEQNEVKTPYKTLKEDTSKTPQISAVEREFNFDTLSRYSYFNNNNADQFKNEKENKDCTAPAAAGSADVVLKTKPQTDTFLKTLQTRGYRQDQINACLENRDKRKINGWMPLSPDETARLLIQTRQMRP
ncbi:winged helix-turn-helix DNA-binding domain protein (plasmid) [Zymomonas mobilis subsp. mobilis ZM4 = ATCC 31821]|nr:winged helix-turn-helix DNA-binding domain protein [Zymomonas mobilis subsp. mobilis]AVZ28813.1 winged helix-turn-helix DNA-binding domain protein [Zymomonas mobilis subsp. mobilis]AVZ43225.1 winged helix-turn-helix DNA-binding domain protein [Zymomonas mobilis subsp. mobilis ZM4 = ATCC 31821]